MSGLEGLLAGHTLSDRYRIEEVIGRGGFAAVYRAQDERLGRTVALKVITLGSADPETRDNIRRRFAREARVAASLHHVNVVTVFDVGTDPRLDLDFLVMELLHGEDLSRRLARGAPLAPRAAVRVVRDAAWGLAAGHRSGLIHRDVKPANIFLAEQERTDRVRICILDFGIAQIRNSENSLTRLTRGGAPLSPPYASPEQLREERDLSPAADVYGLGVIAYQLFAGERPYGPDEIQRMIRGEPPPPPRFAGLGLSPALEDAIRRALEPDPERRFADAGEMAEALDAAYDGLREDGAPAAPVPVEAAPAEAAPPPPAVIAAAPPEEPAPVPAEPSPPPRVLMAAPVPTLPRAVERAPRGVRPTAEPRPVVAAPPPPVDAARSPADAVSAPVDAAPSPADAAPPAGDADLVGRDAAPPPPLAPHPAGPRGSETPRETAPAARRGFSGRRLLIPLVLLLAALGGWWALSRGGSAEPRLAGGAERAPDSSQTTASGPGAAQPGAQSPGAQPAGTSSGDTSQVGTQPGGAGGVAPAPGTVVAPGSGAPGTAGGVPSPGGTQPAGRAPAAGGAPAVGGTPSPGTTARPGAAPATGTTPAPAGRITPPAASQPRATPGTARPPAPRPTPRPAPRETPARPAPSLVARGNAAQLNRAAERLFDQRNYTGAVAGFRRAVAAAPGNSYYRNNLGWAMYMAGDLDGAQRELQATVRMDPRRAIAYANLGEVHWARGDAEGAVANYRRFLELNTDPRRERIATEKLRRMGATP